MIAGGGDTWMWRCPGCGTILAGRRTVLLPDRGDNITRTVTEVARTEEAAHQLADHDRCPPAAAV